MKKYMLLGNSDHSTLGEKNKDNKYEFEYDKNTYNINEKCDSHASLARAVDDNSKVLDVGCSTGKLGSILKDFKNCTIDGIEYESAAFEILKKNRSYSNVYNFSILDNECADFKKLKNEKYDYVIFGDVLEHLVEPWKAILNACELLKDDGKILVSVPNIAHIDIIKGLVNQDFNYKNLGLLDNTHIRFFTEKSFVDMIKNINKNESYNLSVKVIDRIQVKPEYLSDLNFEGIDIINDDISKYYALQIIFEIAKVKDKKSVRYIYDKDDNDYFTDLSKFIIDQNRELVNKINEIKLKNDEIKLKNDEIKLKNDEIKNKEQYINDLNKNIENLNNNIKEEFKKYQRLDKDYINLNDKYQKVINSKGWKILEKLRKVKKKIIKK